MRAVGRSLCRSVAIIIKGIDIFLLSCAPGGVPFPVPFPPERERRKKTEPIFRILMFEGTGRGRNVRSQENLRSMEQRMKLPFDYCSGNQKRICRIYPPQI